MLAVSDGLRTVGFGTNSQTFWTFLEDLYQQPLDVRTIGTPDPYPDPACADPVLCADDTLLSGTACCCVSTRFCRGSA